MKQLFLLRHAKSSWDDSSLPDHDRPLAPRGVRATAVLADHLRAADVAPSLVLCSPARRTRETLEGIRDALGADVEVQFEHELYGASAERLLERVGDVDDSVESVLLIGHNPGIADLALALAGRGHDVEALRGKYPTGALATLAFEKSWRDLAPGRAELTGYVTPKQLKK